MSKKIDITKVDKTEKKEKVEEPKLEVFEEDDYFEEFDEGKLTII